MGSTEKDRDLAAISDEHHGLISNTLVRAHGVAVERLHDACRRRTLVKIDQGLYRIADRPITWHQRLLAAIWRQGPNAVASHRSAALLHGLDPGGRHRPVELVVPRWDRRVNRSSARVHESKDLLPADVTVIDRVPCTTLVRTLIDIPAVLPEFAAQRVFDDAFDRHLCRAEEVTNRFVQSARRGRNGTRLGRSLLEQRTGRFVPTMSEFEVRVASLIEGVGLPILARQVPVRMGDTKVYLDLAWPDLQIAIECTGLIDRAGSRLHWDRDCECELESQGWIVVGLTWEMVTSTPDDAIGLVCTARASREAPKPPLLA